MSASSRHALQTSHVEKPIVARINDTSPTCPCVALRFSTTNDVAYELIKFETLKQFNDWRVMSVGAVRVIRSATDLADVPTTVLLSIFNRSRHRGDRVDEPIARFRDRASAESRTFDVIFDVTTPFQESQMEQAKATSEATTKAEAKAQERKAAKDTKAAAKATETAAKEAAKVDRTSNGVIGNIKAVLESDNGGTVNEILAVLTNKFPERTADGMKSTVKIQTSRLAKTTGRKIVSAEIQGRGRVYKFADKGEIPGERVVEQAAPEVPAATPTVAPAAEEAPAEAPVAKAAKAKK